MKILTFTLVILFTLSAGVLISGEKKRLDLKNLNVNLSETEAKTIELNKDKGRMPQSISEEDQKSQKIKERHQRLQEFTERMNELRDK
jgi:hypothetical protein